MKITEVIQVLLVPVLSALCIVMYNTNVTLTDVRIQLGKVETRYEALDKDVTSLKNKNADNTVGR